MRGGGVANFSGDAPRVEAVTDTQRPYCMVVADTRPRGEAVSASHPRGLAAYVCLGIYGFHTIQYLLWSLAAIFVMQGSGNYVFPTPVFFSLRDPNNFILREFVGLDCFGAWLVQWFGNSAAGIYQSKSHCSMRIVSPPDCEDEWTCVQTSSYEAFHCVLQLDVLLRKCEL